MVSLVEQLKADLPPADTEVAVQKGSSTLKYVAIGIATIAVVAIAVIVVSAITRNEERKQNLNLVRLEEDDDADEWKDLDQSFSKKISGDPNFTPLSKLGRDI